VFTGDLGREFTLFVVQAGVDNKANPRIIRLANLARPPALLEVLGRAAAAGECGL